MGDILSSSDYDDVRALLGTDSDSLPTSVIEAAPFLDFVELAVQDQADSWNSTKDFAWIKSKAGDDWTYLRMGTMYLLAGKLALYAKRELYDKVKMGDYSRSGRALDWQADQRELVQQASQAFARVSTRTWNRPDVLIASGPTSSEVGIPSEWEEWYEMIQPRILDFAEEGEGEDDTYYSTSR